MIYIGFMVGTLVAHVVADIGRNIKIYKIKGNHHVENDVNNHGIVC